MNSKPKAVMNWSSGKDASLAFLSIFPFSLYQTKSEINLMRYIYKVVS
jgi:hypothetical protein